MGIFVTILSVTKQVNAAASGYLLEKFTAAVLFVHLLFSAADRIN